MGLRRVAAIAFGVMACGLTACGLISGAADLRVGSPDEVDAAPQEGGTSADGAVDGATRPPDDARAGKDTSVPDGGADSGRLREVTFENGTLLGLKGADLSFGAPFIQPANGLNGMYSMGTNQKASGVEVDFPAQGELYTTLLVHLVNIGLGQNTILRYVSEALGPAAEIHASNTGELALTFGGNPAGQGGQVDNETLMYRLGVHIKQVPGSTQLEVFLATKGAVFGMPVIKYSAPVMARIIAIRFGDLDDGNIKGSFDDLLVDTVSMPAP